MRWKKFYRRGAEERRDYAEESGFLVDVVDHAGVVVRQEKRVVAEIKNVCGAAVYLAQIEKPGDEVFHSTGFRNSYDTITAFTLQTLYKRTVQRNEKRSVEVLQSEW